MISQQHYEHLNFCTKWAATPKEAIEKLEKQIKDDFKQLETGGYARKNCTQQDKIDLYNCIQQDIVQAKKDLKLLQPKN